MARPKIKMENVGDADTYVALHWNRPRPKSGFYQHIFNSIRDTKVGESFEVEGTYCQSETIRRAFRDRGMRCTVRTLRTERMTGGLRIFKIRAWRVS